MPRNEHFVSPRDDCISSLRPINIRVDAVFCFQRFVKSSNHRRTICRTCHTGDEDSPPPRSDELPRRFSPNNWVDATRRATCLLEEALSAKTTISTRSSQREPVSFLCVPPPVRHVSVRRKQKKLQNRSQGVCCKGPTAARGGSPFAANPFSCP